MQHAMARLKLIFMWIKTWIVHDLGGMSRLRPTAAQVLQQHVVIGHQGDGRAAFEGQLQDVAAATLQHLAAH